MNIIVEKINRMAKEEDKIEFISLIQSFGIICLERLTLAKGVDFVNYESFIDQIKRTIRGIVGDRRSQLQGLFSWSQRTFQQIEKAVFTAPGHRYYLLFYIWAGILQEAFPNGAEKDEKIMEVCQLYNEYGLKKDSLAQKMVRELVDQIEDQEKKREALRLV